MNYTPYDLLTNEAAPQARAALADCLHGEDPSPFTHRLAINADGIVGLLVKQPLLYDPQHTTLSPSGRPWIPGDGPGPTERNWLASERSFYGLTEALEILRGPPERNPEVEVERRQREANDRAAVARRRDESLAAEHNERLEANRQLQERRRELGCDVWERELPGVGKLAFRLEAACRKVGQTQLADEIRLIALESLLMTSASPNARLEVTEPRQMYLDGPSMLTEKWLP